MLTEHAPLGMLASSWISTLAFTPLFKILKHKHLESYQIEWKDPSNPSISSKQHKITVASMVGKNQESLRF